VGKIADQPLRLYPANDPDAIAVRVVDGRTRTWNEVEARGRRLARALGSAGLSPGGAFAVLAENDVEWAELYLGNARAGTRLVPLNWHLTNRELSDLLIDSGSRLLVSDHHHADVAREAAALAGVDRVVVFGDDYESLIAAEPDEVLPERPAGSMMRFTGGTTGRS
jgi:long-chain acyl-CoA synthetase